jgi:hypothetical protein
LRRHRERHFRPRHDAAIGRIDLICPHRIFASREAARDAQGPLPVLRRRHIGNMSVIKIDAKPSAGCRAACGEEA